MTARSHRSLAGLAIAAILSGMIAATWNRGADDPADDDDSGDDDSGDDDSAGTVAPPFDQLPELPDGGPQGGP